MSVLLTNCKINHDIVIIPDCNNNACYFSVHLEANFNKEEMPKTKQNKKSNQFIFKSVKVFSTQRLIVDTFQI